MTSHSDWEDNRPYSEIYYEAGMDWADKEAAATLLEDTKSAFLAQWCSDLGDLPVNRAEQTVKGSDRWMDHLEKIVKARLAANKAKVRLESIKMRSYEWQAKEANARVELKLTS
jgi:hypothetical protein